MTRLTMPAAEDAPEASRPTLAAVAGQLGWTPNFFRVLANSPAALSAHAASGQALGRALDLKMRERIALVTAAVNGCDYCAAAHGFTGHKFAKLSLDDIEMARAGEAEDARVEAALHFAREVAQRRGKVSDDDITTVEAAGWSDAQIVEIVAVVAENFFTNLLNNVAQTDVDFPAFEEANA